MNLINEYLVQFTVYCYRRTYRARQKACYLSGFHEQSTILGPQTLVALLEYSPITVVKFGVMFYNFLGRCVGNRAQVDHNNTRKQFCPHVSVGAPTIQCIIRLTGKVLGSVSPHRTVVGILVRASFGSSTEISKVTGSIVSTLPCPSLNQDVQQLHTP